MDEVTYYDVGYLMEILLPTAVPVIKDNPQKILKFLSEEAIAPSYAKAASDLVNHPDLPNNVQGRVWDALEASGVPYIPPYYILDNHRAVQHAFNNNGLAEHIRVSISDLIVNKGYSHAEALFLIAFHYMNAYWINSKLPNTVDAFGAWVIKGEEALMSPIGANMFLLAIEMFGSPDKYFYKNILPKEQIQFHPQRLPPPFPDIPKRSSLIQSLETQSLLRILNEQIPVKDLAPAVRRRIDLLARKAMLIYVPK